MQTKSLAEEQRQDRDLLEITQYLKMKQKKTDMSDSPTEFHVLHCGWGPLYAKKQ